MRIPILHLEDGRHQFNSRIEPGKYHFEGDEIYPNGIEVRVRLDKFEKNLKCHIWISSGAHYTCDRCLAEYDKPFKGDFELLFHIGMRDLVTDEDDVVLLPPETVDIDLQGYINEFLILNIPMKTLCKENCLGLCPHCGADLNKEPCTCKEVQIDPRWAKLQSLLPEK